MLVIDGVFVNEGGSLVLLNYLISELEKRNIDCIYLLDKRAQSKFGYLNTKKVFFIDASIRERNNFYKSYKGISKIFCFNSAPISVDVHAKVIVYFHNPYLIKPSHNLSLVSRVKYFIKQIYIILYASKVDLWIVQNNSMKMKLLHKFSINMNKIQIVPFYPPLPDFKSEIRVKNSFLYVSTYYPHKNHEKLIEAFCLAYDKEKCGKLTLTVPQKAANICQMIIKRQEEGYPIENLGFIERADLAKIYKQHEYLIFPSFDETFGLGLVEAIDQGCKVIGADLDYTYEVCEPSLVFNPFSVTSIMNSFIFAMGNTLNVSNKKINNDLDLLLNLLKANKNEYLQ